MTANDLGGRFLGVLFEVFAKCDFFHGAKISIANYMKSTALLTFFYGRLDMIQSMTKQHKNKELESDWLSNAMDDAGVSRKELALKSGMEPNWISQWKSGIRPMPDIAMLKIARILNADPYTVRPSLLEYAEFYQSTSILDGLSEESKAIVLQTINHLKQSSNVSTGKVAVPKKAGDNQSQG